MRREACVLVLFMSFACFANPAQSQPTAEQAALIQEARNRAGEHFRAQKFAEAAEAYREVVAADPSDGGSAFNFAYSLHMSGKIDEAIPQHERASRFPGARQLSLYNLGCAHALKGRTDEAFAALTRAIDAGFSRVETMKNDTDLESIRTDARFSKLLEDCAGAVEPRRRFDFWVGEWDVYNPQGVKVGESRIELLERGALIMENWDNTRGGTGRSMNFVDPEDGLWKQVWVDQSGSVVRYSGAWENGALRLSGTATATNGKVTLTRCTFTPVDGGVRQFIERSADSGVTWAVYFDGHYKPKMSSNPGDVSEKPAGVR